MSRSLMALCCAQAFACMACERTAFVPAPGVGAGLDHSTAALVSVVASAAPAASQGPVKAFLEGPAHPKPGDTVEVTLVLDRASIFEAPVSVTALVPEGAVLRRDKSAGEREELRGTPSTRLIYRLELARIPAEDLVLKVDAQEPAWGYHAELRYAFGRSPVPLPTHPQLGAPVRVGTRDLGSSVLVSSPGASFPPSSGGAAPR